MSGYVWGFPAKRKCEFRLSGFPLATKLMSENMRRVLPEGDAKVIRYGMAFCEKECRVEKRRLGLNFPGVKMLIAIL